MHPASGVQPWEDAYPAMARAMGIDPATQRYVPFDITNKKFGQLSQPVAPPSGETRHRLLVAGLARRDDTSLKSHVVAQLCSLHRPREGKRPLPFHRWGGLGNHRYQIGFSGDTISVWASLAFQLWFTATVATAGYACWSRDIGGHMPGVVDPSCTRAGCSSAFSPILRTHTTKNPHAEPRIWAYPKPYSDIIRKTYHLRSALLPYIYNEARRTYDTGVAFLHPLYYDWPEGAEAYANKNEYVFGANMIVDPVVKPGDKTTGLASQSVWLPVGDWVEWQTGSRFHGAIEVNRNFSIRQIPVYVRAGAIVPEAPPMQYTSQKPLDPLIVNVFPLEDGESSSYTLYEDAGNSRDYQRGEFARTELRSSEKGSELTVEIVAAKGTYKGMPTARGYEIRLPGDWPPETATVNEHPLTYTAQKGTWGWRFEGNTLTTIITVPRTAVTTPVTVRVRRSAALFSRRKELDGFAGAMTRLREAYDNLNQTFPIAWSPDELVDAMQTGDRPAITRSKPASNSPAT
jgi:alpha-glucosidase